MHWKRWITALVAVPLLLFLILKGGPVLFSLAIIAVSTISLWEYFRIVFPGRSPSVPIHFQLYSYVAGVGVVLSFHYQSLRVGLAILVVHLIGAAFLSIFRFSKTQDAPSVALTQVFSVLYIPLLLSFAVLLYDGGNGMHWIFWLLLVVIAGDTGAFYVGTFLGKHKLCPAVSPKKTIEGAIGGLVASIIVGTVYRSIFMPSFPLSASILFAVVVGIVGQAGDLFESEFKRAAGVKDSGGLLPGHGGFLDRIDALLFATPVAYLLKDFLLS